MRIHRTLVLTFAALLFCAPSTLARAADVAFFPAETSNLSPSDALAVGELLAQAYAGVSRQAVLSPSRTQDVLSRSPSYEAAAATLGVQEYVRTSTLAVGRLIVITGTRFRADGSAVYQSKMTANTIEDVPNVSDRMAKALFHQVDDEEVRTRHNVTGQEARLENRRPSEKVIGFKAGLYFPWAHNANISPVVSLQFDMRMEMNRFFLEFGAGLMLPTVIGDRCDGWTGNGPCTSNRGHMGALTAELGASYYLTDGNVAPYLGVGLLPRLLFNGNGELAMMSGYGQFGLMLPRDSSTRFYCDVRVAQAITDLRLENHRTVNPLETDLHVGVGW